jgi:hypothetical protein
MATSVVSELRGLAAGMERKNKLRERAGKRCASGKRWKTYGVGIGKRSVICSPDRFDDSG